MTTIIDGTAGVTFPAGGVGNPASAVVGLTDTQTLTNKTLTTPNLGTPSTLVLTNATGLPAAQLTGTQTLPRGTLPTGSVLQIVNATYSTFASSSSSTFADTGLTASITPSSASNKILVIATIAGIAKLNNTSVQIRLVRGATSIATIESGAGYTNDATWNRVAGSSVSYLDSPSTTSSTTYKTQFASADNIGTAYVQLDPAMSTITLMEIAA